MTVVSSYVELRKVLTEDPSAKPAFPRSHREKFPQTAEEQEAVLDIIELLGRAGKSRSYIASYGLGIARQSMDLWTDFEIHKDCPHLEYRHALAGVLRYALQTSKGTWEDRLERSATHDEGNANAIMHAMKARFRGRSDEEKDAAYGDKQELEHAGAGGAPLGLSVVFVSPDDPA